ncbi:MAG: hypothetical protein H7258_10955 [Ferruginibacter sp.]|nr:hypothetical protein [Ferruginibacter sp.]
MKHPKLRKELLLAVSFSIIYLLLSIFQFHLDKFLQGIRIDIIIGILLSILLIMLVIQVFKIISRRKKSKGRIKLKFVFYLPAIILAGTVIYAIIPFKLDSEKLESKVILRGCYEGGNSKAFIRFRANNNFEIKWKTEADNDEWFTGIYRQNKDTFFLTYYEKIPDKFGSIILNTGQSIKSLDKSQSLENAYISFYVGRCKGLYDE